MSNNDIHYFGFHYMKYLYQTGVLQSFQKKTPKSTAYQELGTGMGLYIAPRTVLLCQFKCLILK